MNWVPNAAFTQPERVFELVMDELRARRIKDMLYLGFTEAGALFLPASALDAHAYCLGGTRSGKSCRALMPLLAQMIRWGKRVWLIDCKPERALWPHLQAEAQRAGRKATIFSLYPGGPPSDFEIDVFADLHGRSPQEVSSHLVSALQLDGAKEQFFSDTNRTCLSSGLGALRKKGGPPSFERLAPELVRLKTAFPHAQHVRDVVSSLASEPMFNPRKRPRSLEEVAASNEIVYFCVPISSEKGNVGKAAANLILRLAALSQRDAAMRGQDRERLFLAVDEFQGISDAQSVRNVLAEASAHGVSLLLSHQTKDQVQDRALAGLLRQVGLIVDFSPIEDEFWLKRSGQVWRDVPVWGGDDELVSVREQLEYRFDYRDLNFATRTPGMAVVDSPHAAAELELPQVAFLPYHVSAAEAKHRETLFRTPVSLPAVSSRLARRPQRKPASSSKPAAKRAPTHRSDPLLQLYEQLKRETLLAPIL